MREVFKIFEDIKNTSGINDKKAIVNANKDNELFKTCLVFLLDGNVVTGISSKKIDKKVLVSEYILATFEDVIKYLSSNNTGTDYDISMMQSFINNQPVDMHNFYAGMITKSYKLGCDAKLVNSVIPNLIPTFDVMLGTPIDKCKLIGNEWISLSRKLNGTRCAFIGNKCMTRQGKEYKGLNHIVNELVDLGYSDFFIDGELLYKNEEGLSDSEAFQKGTGIAMSKSEDKSELKLVVFDIFPLSEFWNGESKENYMSRSDKYLMEFKENIKNSKNLDVVEIVYRGFDHSQIWTWLDHAEKYDWEGIMINLNTKYECKRTKNLIKVKKFFDTTLRITDIEEGTGRNKGRLGALVCRYYDNVVKIGSGFTDEERVKIFDYQYDYIGRLVDCKYKEKTKDKKTGLESLQFPVFLGFRFDKDVADDEV